MGIRHSSLSNRASKKAHLALVRLECRCVPHQGIIGHVHHVTAVGPDADGQSDLIHDHDEYGDDTLIAQPWMIATGPFPPVPPMPSNGSGGGGGPAGPLSPMPITYSTTSAGLPELNGLPGAPTAIFLDFDGEVVGSTTYLPYDNDGDNTSFSLAEQQTIVEVWRQISVYYSMFDVNVTTVKPVGVPMVWALESNSISGGYSYVNVFPNNQPLSFNQSSDSRNRVSGIAHEIGHNFGLSHQSDYNLLGVKTAEYSSGYALHGPIMGVDFAQNVHKFTWGHPSGSASSLQDDITVIANKIKAYQSAGGDGFRADDHAGTANAAATPMPLADGYFCGWGGIERLADVDAFSFASTGGQYGIYGNANTPSGLDVKMEVYDAAGNRLATVDTAVNDQNLVMDLPAGTYYVLMSSEGNYADVGAYHLTVRPLPTGWNSRDIGTVVTGGYAGIDPGTGIWRVGGSGSDIWNTADHFRFAYIPLNGNGSITAKVTLVESTHSDAKAGVMIRESIASGAVNAFMMLKPGSANYQYRTSTNGSTTNVSAMGSAPYWVRLTRTGNSITGEISANGTTWATVSTQTVSMPTQVLIGLAVTSYNNSHYNQVNDATFESVSLTGSTGTAAPTYNALPAPAAPILTLGTGTDIVATWNAVPGASSYAIDRSPDGVNWTQVATTTLLTHTSTGLTGSARYFFRVMARDAAPSNSLPSPVASTINRPSAVTNFSVTSLSTTQLVLNWRETTGESGYRVERSPDGVSSWTAIASLAAHTPSYSNTGLTGATAYSYRVIPTSDLGDGVTSAIYTTSTRLNAVTGLQITQVLPTQISLSWTGGVTGATGYRIQRSTDGVTYTTLTTIAGTTYTATSLTPLTSNYFRVAAVNAYSESITQPVVFAATLPNPALATPWADQDVGSVGGAGNAGIAAGVHTVIGSGNQISGTSDAFNFLYQPLSGDGSITARIATEENTTNAGAGIMIRESLAANARLAYLGVTPTNGSNWVYRSSTGGAATSTNTTGIAAPYWLRITRAGNVFTAERSSDGVAWTAAGNATVTMATSVYVGMAVFAGDNTRLNLSTFTNVTVNQASLPPVVLQSTPSGAAPGPVASVRFDFTQAMNQTSFSTAADIVSFTGPAGNIVAQITGHTWLSPTSLQVNVGSQLIPGAYSLTIGSQVLATNGFALDQNGNGTPGEASDGYTAGFTIGRSGDGFGYAYDAIPYDAAWILSPTDPLVTSIGSLANADDSNTSISLGANKFRFYGVEYTSTNQLFVATNGLISFSSGTSDYTNLDLTATPSQATIAALWDDLVTNRNTATDDLILYKFVDLNSDMISDRLVITWRNVHYYQSAPVSGDDGITLQMVLELNTGARSGDIEFHYTDLGETGSGSLDNAGSATAGIKDVGTQGSNRVLIGQDGSATNLVGTGKAVRLYINQAPTAEAGGPYALAANGTVQLNGLASTDPNQSATALYYLWDLDSDGLFGEAGAQATRGDETGASPTFIGNGLVGPSNYNVALKVIDEFGIQSADAALVTIPAPPVVAAFQVGDGSVQRSVFYDVTVTFDRIVTFPLTPSTAVVLTGPGSVTVPTTVTLDNTSGQTKAKVSFGQLADAKFALSLVSTLITDGISQALDGDANGLAGGAYIANFHHLFGDADGDGAVAGSDFNVFRVAFGGTSPVFDYDGDGAVAASDFTQFRQRFGSSV